MMKAGRSIQSLECGCFYQLMQLVLILLLTVSKWLLITLNHRFVNSNKVCIDTIFIINFVQIIYYYYYIFR